MDLLFLVIAFIFGILQIMLFFKVWGMCDDVAKLADKFTPTSSKTPESREDLKQEIEDTKYRYMKW